MEEYITVPMAAARANRSLDNMRRVVRSGAVASKLVGHNRLVAVSSLDEWIAASEEREAERRQKVSQSLKNHWQEAKADASK